MSGGVDLTMNQNEMLDNPRLIWDEDNRGDLTAAGLTALWGNKRFRDRVTNDMVKMIDKEGGFGSDWDLWEVFAEALSEDQVLRLFDAIRTQTDRMESEWRGEFESIFEGRCDNLPEPEIEEDEEEFDPSEEEDW